MAIALAGLADAHAGALTAASLSAGGSLTPHSAALAALAAIAVNTVVKVVLAFAAGGRRVGTTFALALIIPTAVTAATMLFTLLRF